MDIFESQIRNALGTNQTSSVARLPVIEDKNGDGSSERI